MPLFPRIRMRPADPRERDFHLLEELATPQACLGAGRISVFVYHDGPMIREIVVAGHAESITCGSVTSILIETAKKVDDNVQWMLTCGAGYFRVTPPPMSFVMPYPLGDERVFETQGALNHMIEALHEVAAERGLVEIVHTDWARLDAFRQTFGDAARAARLPEVVIPADAGRTARVLDYVPIVPGRDPGGEPLEFRIEGWDFDCPGFQSVADKHLRKVRRELLRDALRRRRTYRGWLKEWMERWVELLRWLPREEAEHIELEFPGAEPGERLHASFSEFLADHADGFLDRGQRWHKVLSYGVSRMRFGLAATAQLDEEIHPQTITMIDFQRLEQNTRPAEAHETFTMRERIMQSDPGMISHCLDHIRRMDTIIAPYEELRSGRGGAKTRDPRAEREAGIVDAISKQIVMETMIRGWPSFYLDDEEDEKAFAAWADVYRPHVWKLLARQAAAKGVALDILLEDNVVYDVRFDGDLGCVIRPLMLVDDSTHVQLHGSRAGASIAVPMWPRRAVRVMPAEVLQAGPNNRARAVRLVSEACSLAAGEDADPHGIAAKLRNALACHPGEAGKLILAEWLRRLGRDTSAEFAVARSFIEATELFGKRRYPEARTSLAEYFRTETEPVADAYVVDALSELLTDDHALREAVDKAIEDYQPLAKRHDALAAKLRAQLAQGFGLQKPSHRDVEALVSMRAKVDELTKMIETEGGKIKRADEMRMTLIRDALRNPDLVRKTHPRLALAAEKAHAVLETAAEKNGFYAGGPGLARYGDAHRAIEVRGLLGIIHALAIIAHRIEKDANAARLGAVTEMQKIASALWLPGAVGSDLRLLAEEFGKGTWDRLQTLQVSSMIGQTIASCLSRMQELLSSRAITGVPLKETIATRIHVTHRLEWKYRTALTELLEAKVAFGCATDRRWRILDDGISEFPEDGELVFDANECRISIESGGARTPLLQTSDLSPAEVAFVGEAIADGSLLGNLNRYARVLAEAVLAAEVEPRPEWRIWRDSMALIQTELIAALSNFGFEVNLMADYAPPASGDRSRHEEYERRMNDLPPRAAPSVDWAWSEIGGWEKLAGPTPRRSRMPLRFA